MQRKKEEEGSPRLLLLFCGFGWAPPATGNFQCVVVVVAEPVVFAGLEVNTQPHSSPLLWKSV